MLARSGTMRVGKRWSCMAKPFLQKQNRPAQAVCPIAHAAEFENSPIHHDMDPSLPADAPNNVVRKSQQLKARAVAGRHIDQALSRLSVSNEAKAWRKAKLIDLPAGTPPKRRGNAP